MTNGTNIRKKELSYIKHQYFYKQYLYSQSIDAISPVIIPSKQYFTSSSWYLQIIVSFCQNQPPLPSIDWFSLANSIVLSYCETDFLKPETENTRWDHHNRWNNHRGPWYFQIPTLPFLQGSNSTLHHHLEKVVFYFC